MNRLLKNIKTIIAIILLILALGICGRIDADYQGQRAMMAGRNVYEQN